MKWIIKKFKDLTVVELHDIIKLRLNIFVVEQDCVYLDLDGKDFEAYHFFCKLNDGSEKIIAYTRLFGPHQYYKEASIGRVVVHKEYRKDGLGFKLMSKSSDQIEALYNTKTIKIGAQRYLQKFYESLGYVSTGDFYMEDGIPHMYMIKS